MDSRLDHVKAKKVVSSSDARRGLAELPTEHISLGLLPFKAQLPCHKEIQTVLLEENGHVEEAPEHERPLWGGSRGLLSSCGERSLVSQPAQPDDPLAECSLKGDQWRDQRKNSVN